MQQAVASSHWVICDQAEHDEIGFLSLTGKLELSLTGTDSPHTLGTVGPVIRMRTNFPCRSSSECDASLTLHSLVSGFWRLQTQWPLWLWHLTSHKSPISALTTTIGTCFTARLRISAHETKLSLPLLRLDLRSTPMRTIDGTPPRASSLFDEELTSQIL